MKLTQEQIEEIRKRAEAATPGIWESFPVDGTPEYVVLGENKGEMVAEVIYEKSDAEFIANARQDIPALLAHIAELESKVSSNPQPIIGFSDRDEFDELMEAMNDDEE